MLYYCLKVCHYYKELLYLLYDQWSSLDLSVLTQCSTTRPEGELGDMITLSTDYDTSCLFDYSSSTVGFSRYLLLIHYCFPFYKVCDKH